MAAFRRLYGDDEKLCVCHGCEGRLRQSSRIEQTGFWRRCVVGLAALALVLQGLSLFVSSAQLSPAEAAFEVLAGLPGVSIATPILCLNVDGDGKTPVHRHDTSSCPMCQLVGASLAGAPDAPGVMVPATRLLGVLAIAAPESAPRAPPHFAANPRGPPVTV
jgi:hypothetical protein